MDGWLTRTLAGGTTCRAQAGLAVAALAMSLIAVAPTAAGEPWAVYRHPNPSFAIVHPADWSVVRDVQGVAFGAHVIIGEKPPGDVDVWPLHVLVRSLPFLPGTTLETMERDWWALVRSPKPGYAHLRLDRTEVDGRPALIGYSMQPRTTPDRGSSYVMEMILITNGRIYVIDARALATSRHLMADVARLRQIILTFRVF